jgi:hypothetical protein
MAQKVKITNGLLSTSPLVFFLPSLQLTFRLTHLWFDTNTTWRLFYRKLITVFERRLHMKARRVR